MSRSRLDFNGNPAQRALYVASAAVILILWWLVFSPTVSGLVGFSQAFGPLMSGIGGAATLALAYLYTQQHQVLKTQTELQEIEHEPSISADRIKGEPIDSSEGSQYKVELSNTGKGVARNLRLRIQPSTDTEGFHPETTIQSMARERQTGSGNPWVNTQSAYLNPGDSQVVFTAHAGMKLSDTAPPNNEGIFEYVTDELDHNGVEQMTIKLFVEYVGPDGEERADQIFDYRIPIKGRTTLRYALLNGLPEDSPKVESRVDTARYHMTADSDSTTRELL
ncbi:MULTISPECIES: hypothetical protein [Halobacterium]|uniref:hypothetical protein n=1 Tax=Halobacterium TaxID=2239 RepID=UPI000A730201|nr:MULTISPECIES: hypothetical protein [Halobacterium]MCG1002615.1 hypothetical protein [Halobacterium noricense]